MRKFQIEMLLNDRLNEASKRYRVLIAEYSEKKARLAGLREMYAELTQLSASETGVSDEVWKAFLVELVDIGEKTARDMKMVQLRVVAELKAYTTQISDLREEIHNAKS